MRAFSPASRVTVAELDPQVTRTATESLFLDPAGMRIVHEDARRVLAREPGSFDVVVGDVFHDVAIPYHLVTREFAALVKSKLAPSGLYAMNLVDAFPDPRLVKAMLKTLETEFRHLDVRMEGMPEASRVTYVLTATDGEPLPERVPARWGFERTWLRVTELVAQVGTDPAEIPLLTDDFAPVESLIAGLLIGRDG